MRGLTACALAALVLAAPAGQPRARAQARKDQSPEARRNAAVEVWRKYTNCQLSQQYAPCYVHLSAGARRRWAEQGRRTADEYADTKASEALWFRRFQLVDVKIDREKAIVSSRVEGGGERGAFGERVEYILVREDGEWRIDAIWERRTLYLPQTRRPVALALTLGARDLEIFRLAHQPPLEADEAARILERRRQAGRRRSRAIEELIG